MTLTTRYGDMDGDETPPAAAADGENKFTCEIFIENIADFSRKHTHSAHAVFACPRCVRIV